MAAKVFVARHGERIDHVDKNWKATATNASDPFLTHCGIRQAAALGKRLESVGLSHIFCSPFYRTIQTANEVAKITGVSIKVESGLSEFLNPEWFPTKPSMKSMQQLKDEFPSIDDTYTSKCIAEYPETREKLIERAAKVANLLATKYSGNILFIAHGIVCEYTVRGLTNTGPVPYISYCSLLTCAQKKGSESPYYSIENSSEPDVSFMPVDVRPDTKSGYR